MKWTLQSGFTLIELLVVISVIGILAALLLANFAGIRDRADDAAKKGNIKQFQNAMRAYYNDIGAYPTDWGGAAGASQVLSTGTTRYIDPSIIATLNSSNPEVVRYRGNGDRFVACKQLANANDREREVSGANGKCSTALSDPVITTGFTSVNFATTPYFCVCAN